MQSGEGSVNSNCFPTMLATLLLLLCASNCFWLSAASSCQAPPGLPGRDGRDGRDGMPGPTGPPGSPGHCDGPDNSSDDEGPGCPVQLKRLLTPRALHGLASLSDITNVTDREIHFTVSQLYSRLVRLVLGGPGQVPPSSSINLAVSIELHFLRSPTGDSDPIVAICDDTICNAVAILDSGNHPNPCRFGIFTPGPNAIDVTSSADCGGEVLDGTVASTSHPRMVTLTFALNQRWASFSIPAGNGFTASGTFDRQLEFTRGLSVEIYGDDAGEQYRLALVDVEVIRQ